MKKKWCLGIGLVGISLFLSIVVTSAQVYLKKNSQKQSITMIETPITKQKRSQSVLQIKSVKSEVMDGVGQMDEEDEPGYDASNKNGRVRSFDSVVYHLSPVITSSNQIDKYTNIVYKITGDIQNGVSSSGKRLNAKFSAADFGVFDLAKKTSTMSVEYKTDGSGNVFTSTTTPTFPISMEVKGATNNTKLRSSFKIQIVSAQKMNDSGQAEGPVIDLTKENVIKQVEFSPVIVSSKVNLYARIAHRTDGQKDFNRATGTTDYPDSDIGFSGVALGIKPFRQDKSLKGVSFPDENQDINVKINQKIAYKKNGSNTQKILQLGEGKDQLPLWVLNYGNFRAGNFTPNNVQNNLYKNYLQPQHDYIQVPFSYGANLEVNDRVVSSVYKTGDIKMERSENNGFVMKFNQFEISDYFPQTNSGAQGGDFYYTNRNILMFASGGIDFVQPYTYLTNQAKSDGTLYYTTEIDAVEYVDATEKKVLLKSDVASATWSRTATPNGLLNSFMPLKGIGNRQFGTQIQGWIPSHDGVATTNQKLEGWAYLDSGAIGWSEAFTFTRWNPAGLIYDKTRTISYIRDVDDMGKANQVVAMYGIKKNKVYPADVLNKAIPDDYKWYTDLSQIVDVTQISAIKTLYTPPSGLSNSTIRIRSILPLQVVGKTGVKDELGNPFIILNTNYAKFHDSYQSSNRNPYTPSTYDEQRNVVSRGNQTYGDTFSVAPFNVTIGKTTANGSANFNSGNKVDWVLTPDVSSKAEGALPKIEYEIRDVLPKGMQYLVGSAKFGHIAREPDDIIENTKGETQLIWKMKEQTINAPKEKLTYQTRFRQSQISFDAGGNGLLQTSAEILAEGDSTEKILRTSTKEILVKKSLSWSIDKEVNFKYLESAHSELEYTLTVYNGTAADMQEVKLLDILPQNNYLNSHISGKYYLKDATLPDGNCQIYYTESSIDPTVDPQNIQPQTDPNWKIFHSNKKEKVAAKSILYVFDKVANEQQIPVKFTLQLDNMKPGDVLNNRVVGNSSRGVSAESNIHSTAVINRSIRGNVWYDVNYDGERSLAEPVYTKMPVYVYQVLATGQLNTLEMNQRGEPLVSSSGASLIKTDSLGNYQIDALPSGDYVVGFGVKEQIDNKELYITKPEAKDVLSTHSSKVSLTQTFNNTILTPIEKKYHLPTALETTTANFIQDYVHLGVLKAPEITIQKNIYKLDENGQKIELHQTDSRVGERLYYELTLQNTQDYSMLQQIKIQEKLPPGFAYQLGSLMINRGEESQSSLPDASFSNNELLLKNLVLGSKEVMHLSFQVLVTPEASGKMANQTTISGQSVKGNYKEKTKLIETTVSPLAKISKTANTKIVKIGEEITYTLQIENEQGGGNWQKIQLQDVLPKELSYQASSTKVDGVTVADKEIWQGNILTFKWNQLYSNEKKVLTFRAKVKNIDSQFEIKNSAVVHGVDRDQKNYEVKSQLILATKYVRLYLRQVVEQSNLELVPPIQGFVWARNSSIPSKQVFKEYALKVNSISKEQQMENNFSKELLWMDGEKPQVKIQLLVPEYFTYTGYTASEDFRRQMYKKMDIEQATIHFGTQREKYVTLYIKGNTEQPAPYSWAYKLPFHQLK